MSNHELMDLYYHMNYCKNVRLGLKISQTEMSKLVGVSRQSISNLERGIYKPSLSTWMRYNELAKEIKK
jgi:DNA-binding XRE family transcriptional regulator